MNIKKILPMELNFELKNIKEYFRKKNVKNFSNKPKVIFCDAATYNNLGDQAIAYAISEFLKNEFKEYEYIEITEKDFLRNFKYLKKTIGNKDIICMSGGGNMGNLYPRYESIRRKVIKNIKDNKILIFPQTIDYENDSYGKKELKRSAKIYNSNKNLIVYARENKSYNYMKEIYKNVELVPDIVFYLNKLEDIPKNKHKKEIKNIGICLREDKESMFSEGKRKKIKNDLIDKNYHINELSTMSQIQYIDYKNRKEILIGKLKEFSMCDLIITDRLHGMIFSILCDVPCIAFDNTNKKVSGVLETVKTSFRNVYMFDKWDISKFEDVKEKSIVENVFNKKEVYASIIKNRK